MRVIYIGNNDYSLTYGKEYEIFSGTGSWYTLTDDNEMRVTLPSCNFEEAPPKHQNQRCSLPTSKKKAEDMLNTKTTYIATDNAKFDDLDIAIAYQEIINKHDDKIFGITKEEFTANSDTFAKKILEAFDLIKSKGGE